ncbi:PadR family transcriptional regulator [Candidatus Izimaplasma bacterium ZiA1]|uniref:PadR family transcriptional regulator n=1 Tax=Candidatus Izimoplasma sp. ZiA1 TaxID=2024899 RepID=UPI000BAA683F|nr:PadR family transcriptional regulator [Candidatus Izimaplasma bacterium ZiA1]
MNPQFKKGIVDIVILNCLYQKDSYGYELVKTISEFVNVKESTIYTSLRKLTNLEFLSTYDKESTDGPKRKYYKVTTSGIDKLILLKDDWNNFKTNIDYLLEGKK